MDSNMKRKIVNLSKGDFIDFLCNDNKGDLIQVFDDEGISYLKQYGDI